MNRAISFGIFDAGGASKCTFVLWIGPETISIASVLFSWHRMLLKERGSLRANGLNRKLFLLGLREVLQRPSEHACTYQKVLFRLAQTRLIPGEIRPVGLLPVPLHER